MTDAAKTTKGTDSSAPSARRWPSIVWRVVACTLALFLLLKWGVIDGYEVRGNSMQPLLVDRADGADRVIVLKPWYRLVEPRRFDLVVFERPDTELSPNDTLEPPSDRFVKRVIGLSGEALRIEDGDVFIDGAAEPMRKPLDVLLEMLQPVAVLDDSSAAGAWDVPRASRRDGVWVLDGTAGKSGALRYGEAIRDDWFDEQGKLRRGAEAVNDVALVARVQLEGPDATLALTLHEAGDTFVVDWSAKGVAHLHRFSPAEERVATESRPDLAPKAGAPFDVLFANVDNEVRLLIDGRPVLTYRYPRNTPVEGVAVRPAPTLEAVNGIARVHAVEVLRDVAYTDDGSIGIHGQTIQVPSSSFFVLGDNSANSRDSRHFGPILRNRLRGRPWCIVSPWHRFRWL